VLDALASTQARQNHDLFVEAVVGNQHRDGPSDRLGLRVAEQPLGTTVPRRYHTLERLADDRIVRRLHDRGEERLALIGRQAGGRGRFGITHAGGMTIEDIGIAAA
jgi:hypothetical protein